jgi:amino acid transporter
MIGWSWVLMTGYWVTTAGSLGTLIAFAAGGSAIALIGLTYSELASAMPRAGGEHIYTHRALGANWSFVCTWALLFSYLAVCVFEAVALPTAVEYLFPAIRVGTLWSVLDSEVDLGFVVTGAAAAIGFTIVNVIGISWAARVQSLVMVFIVIAGVLLSVGGVSAGQWENAQPLIVTPATGILSVLIMVPAMLVGFDVIPQSAEEIDLPRQRIGRLLVISVCLAVAWYIIISFSVALAMPPGQLAASSMATGDAASALWGNSWAGRLLVLGGVGGILTSWNAFIIGASRVMFALAESGYLPAVYARLHPRYKTPYAAIITIGAASTVAPLFGRTMLVWLIDASSFTVMIAFLFVAISFLVLRRTEPDMPRPFEVSHPRLVGGGAVVLSIALLSAYLPWSPSALIWPYEWLMILLWSLLGLVLWWRHRNPG